MTRLSKEKKQMLILVVVGSVGAIVALWFLLISTLLGMLKEQGVKLEDVKAQITKGQRTIAMSQQISNELSVAKEKLTQEQSSMASGDLYDWMIQTMNRFKASQAAEKASAAGAKTPVVELSQISRETPCEAGVLPKFPFRAALFAVQGTAYYHDLGKFLADLENKFPHMRVQNIQMSPVVAAKNEDDERLQFTLELVTLVKPVTP